METSTNDKLYSEAIKAREYAYAEISGFRVGAAILISCGKVFTGCNIEDPSGIGITNICAERCAAVKAISEGYKDFVKIAIAGGADALIQCLPCGACRQYLYGFNPNMIIISEKDGEITEHVLADLLPNAFEL